jgi:hypothetical protein
MKQTAAPAISDAELGTALRDALARLGKPVSVAELRKALPKPYQRPPAELARVLGDVAKSGGVFVISDGKAPKFADRDPHQILARALHEALRGGPLGKKDLAARLKRAAPGLDKLLPAVLAAEVARGAVREHPKVGTKIPQRFGLEPPDPAPFLAKVVKDLEALQKKLAAHGVTAAVIHAAIGKALGVAPAAPPNDEAAVRAALADLAAREPPGALLSVRAVRARAALDKARFDRAVLALAKAGQVELHHHDFPASLPEDERALLVQDGRGTHYVGIALADAEGRS